MDMKKVKKLNEAAENVNGHKAYELWVVSTYPGSDINYVFIKKEDAEVEKERYSKEYYDYYRKVNKQMSDEEFNDYIKPSIDRIQVITLDDAIDKKVSEAIDNATLYNEDY